MEKQTMFITTICFVVFLCVQSSFSDTLEGRYEVNLPEIEIVQHKSHINKLHDREKRKILFFDIHASKKWPNPLKYMLDDSLTQFQKTNVVNVLSEDFERRTCLQFIRIYNASESPEQQFIHFKQQDPSQPSACKAYIGQEDDIRTFHGQPVFLGPSCFSLRGQLVHMIAATLGMFNEVQRPDREKYVDVFFNNIDGNGTSNFVMQSENGVITHDVPYDYGSALHYRSKAWLKREYQNVPGRYTVLPKDRSLTHLLGQMSEISFYDVQVLNHAYCSESCAGNRRACLNGGYQDPNNCLKCLCPDGYHGDSCALVALGSNQCNPVSGKIDATAREKCVNSPNYRSGSYQSGDQCTWLISAPPGKLIDMYFYESVFALPYYNTDTDICIHWVEIKYKGLNATRGARYCSKDNQGIYPTMPTKRNKLTSESSQVMILFRSPQAHLNLNYIASARMGFKLCFNISDKEIITTPPPAPVTDQSTATESVGGLSTTLIVIVIVVVSLLVLLIAFAIVIIVMLNRRRKKTPDTVVVASGMNNPGYASHAFPVVTFNEPSNILDKKMEAFGADGGMTGSELPPKYEDVPPGQAPPYTVSEDYKRNVLTSPQYQADPEPDYEIPSIGGGLVPVSNSSQGQPMSDEPIYQNAPGVQNLRSMFENK